MIRLEDLLALRAQLDVLIAKAQPARTTLTLKKPAPAFEEPKVSSKLKNRQKQYKRCLEKLADPAVQAIPTKHAWFTRFKESLEAAGI